MSGYSRVDVQGEYYHLLSESPCMNFSSENPPGSEVRWHQEWKEKAAAWMDRIKPILERRFAMLTAAPDPDWPLQKYDARLPLWNSYRDPEVPPPWRAGFTCKGGPEGMSEVIVAFSRMPSEEARTRFKRELMKDFAMLDFQERRLR